MEKPFSKICEDYPAEMRIKRNNLMLWNSLCLFGTGILNFNSKSVYPPSLRAFSYLCLDELRTSSLEEFLDKCSLIVFGNSLIICGRWFEDSLIHDNKLFGFLSGLYVPLFTLNVMPKKSRSVRFVSTSIAKPISLNIFTILSTPPSFLLIIFTKKTSRIYDKVLLIWYYRCLWDDVVSTQTVKPHREGFLW